MLKNECKCKGNTFRKLPIEQQGTPAVPKPVGTSHTKGRLGVPCNLKAHTPSEGVCWKPWQAGKDGMQKKKKKKLTSALMNLLFRLALGWCKKFVITFWLTDTFKICTIKSSFRNGSCLVTVIQFNSKVFYCFLFTSEIDSNITHSIP